MTPPDRGPGPDDSGRTPPTPRGRWRGRSRDDGPVSEEETGWITDLRNAQQTGGDLGPEAVDPPVDPRRAGGFRAGASRLADGLRSGGRPDRSDDRPRDDRRPDVRRPEDRPMPDERQAATGRPGPDGW